jgi:hypothetical protein
MPKYLVKALVHRPCAWGNNIGECVEKGDTFVIESRYERELDITYKDLEKTLGKRFTYTQGGISAPLREPNWEITKL